MFKGKRAVMVDGATSKLGTWPGTKKIRGSEYAGDKNSSHHEKILFQPSAYGRNPGGGGRQRGWHPPEVGDKGVLHATILSSVAAEHCTLLKLTQYRLESESTCAQCRLVQCTVLGTVQAGALLANYQHSSLSSHQPCELSHQPPALYLAAPLCFIRWEIRKHWRCQILTSKCH